MNTKTVRLLFFSFITLFLFYTGWIYMCGITQASMQSTKAIQGKKLFQEYNCISCHQVYGLGGYMGPELTNIMSDTNKGEIYAKAFIKNGTQKMPNFKLSDEQIVCLIEYLKEVDISGLSPNYKHSISKTGYVLYN